MSNLIPEHLTEQLVMDYLDKNKPFIYMLNSSYNGMDNDYGDLSNGTHITPILLKRKFTNQELKEIDMQINVVKDNNINWDMNEIMEKIMDLITNFNIVLPFDEDHSNKMIMLDE